MELTTHSNPPDFISQNLKSQELLQCLGQLDIELSKAELMEPQRNKERVKKVFQEMLSICCDLTEDHFEKLPQNVKERLLQVTKYPQTHEDFSELKFFLELRKLMEICGIDDFGWKDLHAPSAKRFRRHLSATINLVKYREDKLTFFIEQTEPRSHLAEALQEVLSENHELNSQLEKAQKDSDAQFSEMEMIEQECEELEMEIGRNNKLQAAMREEATELKKKHNELKDKVATSNLALQEAQVDFEHLQSKIVTSPTRRKNDISQLQERVRSERADSSALEDQCEHVKNKMIHIARANRDVPQTTQLLGGVWELSQKVRQVNEEIRSKLLEQDVIDKKTSDVIEEFQLTEASLQRAEEKLLHSRKQYKLKIDAAQDALESAKAQLAEVERDHMEGMAQVEAGEAEVREMKKRMEDAHENAQTKIREMVGNYKAMECRVLEDNGLMLKAIGVA